MVHVYVRQRLLIVNIVRVCVCVCTCMCRTRYLMAHTPRVMSSSARRMWWSWSPSCTLSFKRCIGGCFRCTSKTGGKEEGEERGLMRVTAHQTRLFYVSHFSMLQLSDLSFPILLAVWWRTLPVSKFRCTSGSPPMQVPCLIAGGRAGSWSSWCSPTPSTTE